MVERCGQWADYSARNQVLLASYGVIGPAAGASTWARVESTEGRPCAVRAGEHGLPVRVPVVEVGDVASDRSRLGGRSGSVAGGHRWEPVFALEQLARALAPDRLVWATVPRLSPGEWCEAVRVASGRVLGRMPRKVTDPVDQLAMLAGRVPHGPGRVRLGPELQGQVAWLVADRVGMAVGPMPPFDPSGSSARERWQTLVDVRRSVGFLTAGVSHALGVELAVSPLPRHELTDDRTVAAGRRNYLAPADMRALPVGVWTEAGPYTKSEWLARGVAGAQGRAAFLRVNDRSYLAAYESRTAALWRLETTGRGAHHGLVAEGTADDLNLAKDSARDALRDRFPDIAVAVDAGVGSAVVSTRSGWHPSMPSTGVEVRVFDERVAATVRPVDNGGWQAAATLDGRLRPGPVVDEGRQPDRFEASAL